MRFVDTHIHGAFGADTSDADVQGIVTMARGLHAIGVEAFCPTTMTIGSEKIFECFTAVSSAVKILENEGGDYARILGIHLEGPFLNPEMAGVQDASCCLKPSEGYELVEALEARFPGLLKIIDISPELEGGLDFIREYSSRYVLSLAHTKADYDIAVKAFEQGASSVTHLLNAMRDTTKRSPGILAAAYDCKDVFCELICDGIHIHPPVLRMLFDLLREDRIIVVSDSMRGAGMPDGEYLLGSAKVRCSGGRTYYGEHGGLAGSVTNMHEEYEKLISYGISEAAVRKAVYDNPLRRLQIKDI